MSGQDTLSLETHYITILTPSKRRGVFYLINTSAGLGVVHRFRLLDRKGVLPLPMPPVAHRRLSENAQDAQEFLVRKGR